jgi:hypothetical protein
MPSGVSTGEQEYGTALPHLNWSRSYVGLGFHRVAATSTDLHLRKRLSHSIAILHLFVSVVDECAMEIRDRLDVVSRSRRPIF